MTLTPILTPSGHLRLAEDPAAPVLAPALAERLVTAFAAGPGIGLLHLGAVEVGQPLPAALAWWQSLAARFVTALCMRSDDGSGHVAVPPPDGDALAELAASAPPMPGGEYLGAEVLLSLWREIDGAVGAALPSAGGSVQALVHSLNPAWNVVGRVHFNLAENRRDADAPFAFLATWTPRLSAHGKAQHLPLGRALREYADTTSRDALLALLLPVQRAAGQCGWLARMVETGEIFHPLRWSPDEAVQLLSDVEKLQRAGVVVRLPAGWRGGRPPRPRVSVTVGGQAPSVLGAGALLDFDVGLSLEGEPLDPDEMRELLSSSTGLTLLRGRWVEVDAEHLRRTLDHFGRIEALAAGRGLGFAEAMRTLAGAGIGADGDPVDREWADVVAGPWLAEVLTSLRSPERLARLDPGSGLHAVLRPYQDVGVRWLHLLTSIGLGACLADDMGLGKTIQVLALLLQRRGAAASRPSLLVAPASLLANWTTELARFAPDLVHLVAHGSTMKATELEALDCAALTDVDLVVTSYGTLARQPGLLSASWDLVILDEAQAIKNPATRQSKAVRKLTARARVALTGTPVENRLGDLWSIFDFLNPGLLGSARQFTAYAKRLETGPGTAYAPLRELVRPYILRRLKTDRAVIADLPDKTEFKAYCSLSRTQAALYQQAVDELAIALESAEGIGRRGLVLATMMRLKQICNHPSQWTGDGGWSEADSGKWARLREICEVVASRQEKALVFTQFREITEPLAAFLGSVFGRPGLVLHGQTPVRRRGELVSRFQEDDGVPFFLLSLKAGGSGLNLTAASHVVHFDRWWNPAVEEQATDRAFRIGQRNNVLVHKFVCRGTIEDRIDQLIESKRSLVADLLDGGESVDLTALPDDELLRLVSLDIHTALKE